MGVVLFILQVGEILKDESGWESDFGRGCKSIIKCVFVGVFFKGGVWWCARKGENSEFDVGGAWFWGL